MKTIAFANRYGSASFASLSETLPISQISSKTLIIPASACFSLEAAEQLALILEGTLTQISMVPDTRLFYLVVHESASTGWLANPVQIKYASSTPACELIEREARIANGPARYLF